MMMKVNCASVELQIGPDAWVQTILANGNGSYDVVTKSGPSGDAIGFDATGAAALLVVEDGQAMLEALAHARARIEALELALRNLVGAPMT